MKRTVLVMLGVLLGTLPWSARPAWPAPEERATVCHRSRGNPTNFQTISVPQGALRAHLAHGDVAGPCEDEAVCTQLCDDGNKCTVDGALVGGSCVCAPQAVDCDDTNLCTADSCDPAVGCQNTARVGAACNDDVVCTGPDTCDSTGQCTGPAVTNCCSADTQCNDGKPCTTDRCDLASNSCQFQAVVCNNPDACTLAVCDPSSGACTTAQRDCADSDPFTCDRCDPQTGCQNDFGLSCEMCGPSYDGCLIGCDDMHGSGCSFLCGIECEGQGPECRQNCENECTRELEGCLEDCERSNRECLDTCC